MTPLRLQAALKKRIEKIVANLFLNSALGERKKVQVFEQHLPEKRKSENRNPEDNNYPCVIVYLDEGEQSGANSPGEARVYLGIGVYDEEADNQGYRDAMNVVEKIQQDLMRNPTIDRRFELMLPIKWKYSDADNGSYHFAWIEATFGIPSAVREDVEELI